MDIKQWNRAVDYVLKLQDEPSTNAKQEIILEAYNAGCDEFFKAFQLAYDSKRVFGVKKVPVADGSIEVSLFGWLELA